MGRCRAVYTEVGNIDTFYRIAENTGRASCFIENILQKNLNNAYLVSILGGYFTSNPNLINCYIRVRYYYLQELHKPGYR